MKCIRCGFTEHEEMAKFCVNCGHELDSNFCLNAECPLNTGEEIVPCAETACYCNVCGYETTYLKKGLVKPLDYKKRKA